MLTKPTRPADRRVELFRIVARRNDDHAIAPVETVQQLEKSGNRGARIAPVTIGYTSVAESVHLIDEQNCGSFRVGLFERGTHGLQMFIQSARRLPAGNRTVNYRDAAGSRQRSGEHRFPRTRRPGNQDSGVEVLPPDSSCLVVLEVDREIAPPIEKRSEPVHFVKRGTVGFVVRCNRCGARILPQPFHRGTRMPTGLESLVQSSP
ncbi:hypothetical protein D9M70_520400 [compost metagenome]